MQPIVTNNAKEMANMFAQIAVEGEQEENKESKVLSGVSTSG
jgi:hypothetical protein